MGKFFRIAICLAIMVVASGCTTIYKTAVDERSVKDIASDTKIKLNIVNAYAEDEELKVFDFFVGVYEGDVYLVGDYKNVAQKDKAVSIAKKTENVKSVTTYLIPEKEDHPCTTKVNLEITARVKGRLIQDKEIWSTNVDVKTVQCNVVLVGLVGSSGEVSKAVEHARGVERVKSVKSFLKTKR